jgi:hypothetical protein
MLVSQGAGGSALVVDYGADHATGNSFHVCPLLVTCRWHVLLDVSGDWAVAKSAEMSVLVSDPEPLLT